MTNLQPDRAPRRLDDLEWSRWVPDDRATLLFVIRNGHILLIRHASRRLPDATTGQRHEPIEISLP